MMALMFRSILLLGIVCLLTIPMFGQAEFSLFYARYNVEEWVEASHNERYDPAFGVSVGYRLPLKNYRVEFVPEVSYIRGGSAEYFQEPGLTDGYVYFHNRLDFMQAKLNIRIYPFDFEGDCNCPTFSKQGTLFKKGFFLQVSGGGGSKRFYRKWGEAASPAKPSELVEFSHDEFTYSYGGGAGLDIGISDLITLTPFVQIEFFPEIFEGFIHCPSCDIPAVETMPTVLSAGVHMGLNWKR